MNPEAPVKYVKMTRFICQELLFEFATGRLDPERQKAMDSYLTGCRDSQRELERLKKGLRYAKLGAKVEVSPALNASLLGFEPKWKQHLRAWTERSSVRGWKALPYLTVGAVLVLAMIIFKPWKTINHEDLVLVQQVKSEPDIVSPAADVKIETPAVTSLAEPPAKILADQPTPLKDLPAKAEPVAESTTGNAVPTPPPASTSAKGFLTRGDLDVSDIETASTAIREKILALGGRVAGNVELGWRRRKHESYFHFSLPESNRAELDLFLKTFGPVRFSREAHPRVMPEGQIRIILTVKDGDTDADEEAEAP